MYFVAIFFKNCRSKILKIYLILQIHCVHRSRMIMTMTFFRVKYLLAEFQNQLQGLVLMCFCKLQSAKGKTYIGVFKNYVDINFAQFCPPKTVLSTSVEHKHFTYHLSFVP